MKKYISFCLATIILFTATCLSVVAQGTLCTDAKENAKQQTVVVTIEDVAAGVFTWKDYETQNPTTKSQSVIYSTTSQSLADGIYCINNVSSGKYAQYVTTATTQNIGPVSGMLATLGNSIKWTLAYSDSGYLIQPYNDSTMYLAVDTNGFYTEILQISTGSVIPARCYWDISIAQGGGCLIETVTQEDQYLTYTGSGLFYISALPSNTSSDSYNLRRWRISSPDYISGKELTTAFTINDYILPCGASFQPTINRSPSNALWATVSDFNYTGYDGSILTLNSYTGTFSHSGYSSSSSNQTITATHKVTNLSKQFLIVLRQQALLVAIPSEGHDHSSCLSTVANLTPYLDFGYTPSASPFEVEYSASSILRSQIDDINCGIFVSRSHGGIQTVDGVQIGTSLLLNDSANKVWLRSNEIPNSTDFSNLKLAAYVACSTGVGGVGGLNLPSVTVARGAETAIGFPGSISCNEANLWTSYFFLYLEQGYDVQGACAEINRNYIVYDPELRNPVICGNASLLFE